MNSLTPANSLINGSPSYNQIGKGGSFWLPPEFKYIKGTLLSDDPKKSKDVKDVNFKSNLSNGSGNKSVSHQFTLKAESTTKLNKVNNSSSYPIKTQNPPSFNESVLKKNDSLQKNLAQIIALNEGLGKNANREKTSMSTFYSSSAVGHSKGKPLTSRTKSDELFLKTNNENNHPDDGTGNAFELMMYLNSMKSSDLTIFSDHEENIDSSLTEEIKNLFGKKILPKISYFTNSGKEVIRFAFDLPDGSPLGIRLEKQKNKLSLCFISPQSACTHSLMSLSEGLKKVFKSHKHILSVFHFDSFSEMDSHFSS